MSIGAILDAFRLEFMRFGAVCVVVLLILSGGSVLACRILCVCCQLCGYSGMLVLIVIADVLIGVGCIFQLLGLCGYVAVYFVIYWHVGCMMIVKFLSEGNCCDCICALWVVAV